MDHGLCEVRIRGPFGPICQDWKQFGPSDGHPTSRQKPRSTPKIERYRRRCHEFALLRGSPDAPLDETDRAVMRLASKVAGDANSVTEDDIAALRELGLADAEIFNVILAAGARSFFGKVLDAAGAFPDRVYNELEEGMREALTFHHQIEGE